MCILVWGDNDPLTGSFWYGAKTLLVPGKSMLFTNQLLGMVRGITTGGSTVHYYATCFPAPFEMLKSYGIDITNESEEMRNDLPVAPLKDEMIGPMATDMAHPFATTALFASGVFRFDKMFSRRNTLQIMVKAKDELGGRLTDSGGIRKVLDDNEKRKLSRGYERAKKILRNAGAKGIFKTGYLAAHPGGTVKVGKLVDSNLKTEYENLYVCEAIFY